LDEVFDPGVTPPVALLEREWFDIGGAGMVLVIEVFVVILC
jgi:hypothetical protein